MGLMTTWRLRRRLESMPLPVPFSIDGLVANLEEVTGRRIVLIEMEANGANLRAACGLRARLHATTWILYRRRPTPNQTLHTILHELTHEWQDHGTNLPMEEVRFLLPEALLAEFDRLGADAVVQARGRYGTPEEREAELGALLLQDMIRPEADGEDMVSLLETTLSHPVERRRRNRNNLRGMR